MRRVVLSALLYILTAGAAGPAAAEDQLTLSYELWKGGFHAIDMDAAVSRTDGDYAVQFTARTRGLIGWLYPYLLEGEAEGKMAGDAAKPDRFATLARMRSKEKRRAISYLADGTPVTWTDPPVSPGDDEGVPTAMRRDTIDPASAILSVAEAVTKAGRCDGSYPVYDGRRRFDLSVRLIGQTTLRPSRYNTYSGPATQCSVTVRKLGGFRDQGADDGMPTVINVWLASVADTEPMVPVRLEGEGGLGNLMVHLVGARLEAITPSHGRERSAAR